MARSGDTDVHRALAILNSAHFDAPLPCELALSRIHTQTGLDFKRARARAGFARGHLLDVVVYLPGGRGIPLETDVAEELVRLLLGEELFERWIGHVLAAPIARGGLLSVLNEGAEERSALPIESLLDSVRAAVRGLQQGLPVLSFAPAAEADDWFAFELSPEPAADYAAQDDLVFCSTRVPEPKKSFLRGEPFFSGRFAISGALFTYLKYDTERTTSEDRLEERSKIEHLMKGLLSERDGTMVGFGLGVRYGYIDLLLADPDCARQRLFPELRALGISKRSWVLFCDSELSGEYLAVHADSPPPYFG